MADSAAPALPIPQTSLTESSGNGTGTAVPNGFVSSSSPSTEDSNKLGNGRRVSGRVKVATKFFKSEIEEPKRTPKKPKKSLVPANNHKVTKTPVKNAKSPSNKKKIDASNTSNSNSSKDKDPTTTTTSKKQRSKQNSKQKSAKDKDKANSKPRVKYNANAKDPVSKSKSIITKNNGKNVDNKAAARRKSIPKPKPKPQELLPEFTLIYPEQPVELTWIRIAVREFLLRFDLFWALPSRQASVIVDPTLPWNEYVYKSIAVLFMGFIFDKVSMNYASQNPLSSEVNRKAILEAALPYKSKIESTSPESEKMWIVMEELCDILEGKYDDEEAEDVEKGAHGDKDEDKEVDMDMGGESDMGRGRKTERDGGDRRRSARRSIIKSEVTTSLKSAKTNGTANGSKYGNTLKFDLFGFEKVIYDDSRYLDADLTELRYLRLIHRILLQAIASTKLRFMINDAQDLQRKLHADYLELIRNSKQNMERSLEKLSNMKVQDRAWGQRFADTKARFLEEQAAYEQFIYVVSLKHNTRTSPIGTDHLGNKYWIFQQLWHQLPSGDSPRAVVTWHKAYPFDAPSPWVSGFVVVEKAPELYSIFKEKPDSASAGGDKANGSAVKNNISINGAATTRGAISGKQGEDESLYCIVGKSNAAILAKWLRNHSKTAVYPLAREIEKFAKYV